MFPILEVSVYNAKGFALFPREIFFHNLISPTQSSRMAKSEEFEKGAQHEEHPSSSGHLNLDEAAELAMGADHAKSSLWTISMIRLYGCLLIGYLCATVNGFDGSVMG